LHHPSLAFATWTLTSAPWAFAENGQRYVLVASGDPGFLKVPEVKVSGPSVLTAFVSSSAKQVAK
jgi:hypothetical protein